MFNKVTRIRLNFKDLKWTSLMEIHLADQFFHFDLENYEVKFLCYNNYGTISCSL